MNRAQTLSPALGHQQAGQIPGPLRPSGATGPAQLTSPLSRWVVTVLAVAGVALLVWSGVIHLQLWSDGYRDISVIGPLFLIQGITSIALALALIVSACLRRWRPARFCPPRPPSGCWSSAGTGCSATRKAWRCRTPRRPWPWSSQARRCSWWPR